MIDVDVDVDVDFDGDGDGDRGVDGHDDVDVDWHGDFDGDGGPDIDVNSAIAGVRPWVSFRSLFLFLVRFSRGVRLRGEMNSRDGMQLNDRFLDLIRDNHLRIQKLCNAYTWNGDDHEDLYQEILCQLWRALPSLKNECYSETWLYRVALNTCISFVRKERKRRDGTVALDDEQALQIPCTGSSQDRLRQAQVASLFQAISKLNPIEKGIVTLFLEELSYKQIAEVTGLSEANVGVTLHRAKKKLSELMKESI